MLVQGTEGHLMVIGHCQVKGLALAMVLDMMSLVDARQLEEDVRYRWVSVHGLQRVRVCCCWKVSNAERHHSCRVACIYTFSDTMIDIHG